MKCFAGFPSWVTSISRRNQPPYVEMMQGIFIVLYWDGQALAQSGFLEWWVYFESMYVWMIKWGSLCHTSYWSRTPEIAVLKNTVICALRSVTVIRHGNSWLPCFTLNQLEGKESGEIARAQSNFKNSVSLWEKLKVNSKEGRLVSKKIKGEIACVADERLNTSFGIRWTVPVGSVEHGHTHKTWW